MKDGKFRTSKQRMNVIKAHSLIAEACAKTYVGHVAGPLLIEAQKLLLQTLGIDFTEKK